MTSPPKRATGLAHARNASVRSLKRLFGEERLAGLIAANRTLDPKELETLILDAVARHCLGNFEDDVTMIVAAGDGDAPPTEVDRRGTVA